VVSSTLRPHFTPGKEPVPILEEAWEAPGPVWTAGKSHSHRDQQHSPAAFYPLERPGNHYWDSVSVTRWDYCALQAVKVKLLGFRLTKVLCLP